MDRAIHLIATGKRQYHRECLAFALHIREWEMNEHIVIHTTNPRWTDWSQIIPDPKIIIVHKFKEDLLNSKYGGDYIASRLIKTQLGRKFSADLNLYLDGDLAAIKDPNKIWEEIPDNSEMALTVESYSNLHDLWLRYKAKDGIKFEEWLYMRENNYVREDVKYWHSGRTNAIQRGL